MSLDIEATYENGVLKLDQPLPLGDHQRVKVTVHEPLSRAKISYGLIGWTGDPEVVRKLALDPEFSAQESP
jgi:predicted DNA-binding antitoxin AbrB/MazE fold protein